MTAKQDAFDLLVAEGVEVVKARKEAHDAVKRWLVLSDEVQERIDEAGALRHLQPTDQLEAFVKSCELAGISEDDDAFAITRELFLASIERQAEQSARLN